MTDEITQLAQQCYDSMQSNRNKERLAGGCVTREAQIAIIETYIRYALKLETNTRRNTAIKLQNDEATP